MYWAGGGGLMNKKPLVTTSTSWLRMLFLKLLACPEITPYYEFLLCSYKDFVMADIYLLFQLTFLASELGKT